MSDTEAATGTSPKNETELTPIVEKTVEENQEESNQENTSHLLEADLDRIERTVHVGNLHFDHQPHQIEEYFSKVGPVERVKIVMQPVTRRPCGYAFVTFKDKESVQKAIDTLDRNVLWQRTLLISRQNISSSTAPKPRGRGSMRGGRGFRGRGRGFRGRGRGGRGGRGGSF